MVSLKNRTACNITFDCSISHKSEHLIKQLKEYNPSFQLNTKGPSPSEEKASRAFPQAAPAQKFQQQQAQSQLAQMRTADMQAAVYAQQQIQAKKMEEIQQKLHFQNQFQGANAGFGLGLGMGMETISFDDSNSKPSFGQNMFSMEEEQALFHSQANKDNFSLLGMSRDNRLDSLSTFDQANFSHKRKLVETGFFFGYPNVNNSFASQAMNRPRLNSDIAQSAGPNGLPNQAGFNFPLSVQQQQFFLQQQQQQAQLLQQQKQLELQLLQQQEQQQQKQHQMMQFQGLFQSNTSTGLPLQGQYFH
jgi:hypothetical protein